MQPWRHKRSPTNLTIEQAFAKWKSYGGVFETYQPILQDLFPWADSLNSVLDDTYIGMRSGGKFVTPYVIREVKSTSEIVFPEAADGLLYPAVRSQMASTMAQRFAMKWKHLFDEIYTANYKPINNSSETRTRTGQNKLTKNLSDATTKPTKSVSRSSTRTPNLSEALTGSSGTTDSTSDTTTTRYGKVNTLGGSNTVEAIHNEYGFNTTDEDGVPMSKDTTTETPRQTNTDSGSDSSTTTGSGQSSSTETRTILTTGTEGVTESESESYNQAETTLHTGTDTEDITDSITIARTGTMFRPPAELLSLDRDLWLWDFFDIVFDDVDSILTLDIYPERPVTQFYWGQDYS